MPIPGEQPDLAALLPESSPVKPRLAAQYVREARDRLTSSSGTIMSCSASTRKIGFPASLVILLLVATVGFMFTLKSKLRIGTEVIVTFPPERVVAAIAPMDEHAPPIASATKPDLTSEENRRFSRRPLFRAGT